jgi:hypothetical protein
MHLNSVDDHLIGHQRVWLDRMPEAYLDLRARVVESGDEVRQIIELKRRELFRFPR